jgi:hypothetical protein
MNESNCRIWTRNERGGGLKCCEVPVPTCCEPPVRNRASKLSLPLRDALQLRGTFRWWILMCRVYSRTMTRGSEYHTINLVVPHTQGPTRIKISSREPDIPLQKLSNGQADETCVAGLHLSGRLQTSHTCHLFTILVMAQHRVQSNSAHLDVWDFDLSWLVPINRDDSSAWLLCWCADHSQPSLSLSPLGYSSCFAVGKLNSIISYKLCFDKVFLSYQKRNCTILLF